MTDTSKKYEAVNTCSDCGTPIGHDDGPSDGWQLERGSVWLLTHESRVQIDMKYSVERWNLMQVK